MKHKMDFIHNGGCFRPTVTVFITLITGKGHRYLGPNLRFGIFNFRYFVERYTKTPTFRGSNCACFFSAWVSYSMAALFIASFTCSHNVWILSEPSSGPGPVSNRSSNSGVATNSHPVTM